jgi:hypothetical protein
MPRDISAAIASLAARSALPSRKSGSATFSCTLRKGTRLGPWKAIEMFAGRRWLRPPKDGQRISPALGSSIPASRWRSVDLPLPDGPITATGALA